MAFVLFAFFVALIAFKPSRRFIALWLHYWFLYRY